MTQPPTVQSQPKVLVLVGDWVEDYEAIVPIQTLQMLGADVHVVSPGKTKGQLVMSCVHDFGRQNIDGATDSVYANTLGVDQAGQIVPFQAVSERYGHAVMITKDYESVDIDEYAGIFVPGGRSPETLQLEDTILNWIRRANERGAILMSICHGVQVLATAGVLDGRPCTGHPCCRCQAQMGGAEWDPTDLMSPVVDGNLITGAEWTATPAMLAEFIRAIGFTTSYEATPAAAGAAR